MSILVGRLNTFRIGEWFESHDPLTTYVCHLLNLSGFATAISSLFQCLRLQPATILCLRERRRL